MKWRAWSDERQAHTRVAQDEAISLFIFGAEIKNHEKLHIEVRDRPACYVTKHRKLPYNVDLCDSMSFRCLSIADDDHENLWHRTMMISFGNFAFFGYQNTLTRISINLINVNVTCESALESIADKIILCLRVNLELAQHFFLSALTTSHMLIIKLITGLIRSFLCASKLCNISSIFAYKLISEKSRWLVLSQIWLNKWWE